jgi:hypothetical protein
VAISRWALSTALLKAACVTVTATMALVNLLGVPSSALLQMAFAIFSFSQRTSCSSAVSVTTFGDDGQFATLNPGPAKYPTDDELVAGIKHPERLRPGIAMPTWDGVIKDDEYAPLVGYVRSLARAAKPVPAASIRGGPS